MQTRNSNRKQTKTVEKQEKPPKKQKTKKQNKAVLPIKRKANVPKQVKLEESKSKEVSDSSSEATTVKVQSTPLYFTKICGLMNLMGGIEKIYEDDIDMTDVVISHYFEDLQPKFRQPIVDILNNFRLHHSFNKLLQKREGVCLENDSDFENYDSVGSTIISIRSKSKEVVDCCMFTDDISLETAERVFKIWDFCTCFKNYFNLSKFKPEELLDTLKSDVSETSPLLSHIFGAIIYKFLAESLNSNDLNITLMKRISQNDYFFIWPEILKVVLSK